MLERMRYLRVNRYVFTTMRFIAQWHERLLKKLFGGRVLITDVGTFFPIACAGPSVITQNGIRDIVAGNTRWPVL